MPESIDRYIAAKSTYERLRDAVKEAIGRLKDFYGPIIEGTECNFVYVQIPGHSIPLQMSSLKALNPSNLPSPEHLQDLLIQRLNAKDAASAAWRQLSPEERSELVPPSWMPKSR